MSLIIKCRINKWTESFWWSLKFPRLFFLQITILGFISLHRSYRIRSKFWTFEIFYGRFLQNIGKKIIILWKNSIFTKVCYRGILHIGTNFRNWTSKRNLFSEGKLFDFRRFIFVLWTTWMLGQPPLAVLPPGKISYTCRIAPYIIINYRLLTYWTVTWWQLHLIMQCTSFLFNWTIRRQVLQFIKLLE